jgi:F-type H+-transporting ATPase subunit beta
MDRQYSGRVVQIQGGVVDVSFPEGDFPEIYEAIEVPLNNDEILVLETQKHLPNNTIRAISMGTTDGLQRGVPARRTGAPIKVPVGEATLGRIFNVLGQPVDNKGPVNAKLFYPIHRLVKEAL